MINNNIKSYIDLSNNSFFNNPLHSSQDKKNINIAVVIHLYHEEQWSSFNSALSNFKSNFTLFVTVKLGSLISKKIFLT